MLFIQLLTTKPQRILQAVQWSVIELIHLGQISYFNGVFTFHVVSFLFYLILLFVICFIMCHVMHLFLLCYQILIIFRLGINLDGNSLFNGNAISF